ncbi:GDSL-type esterase/lipase family protein [Kineococcus sp. SYSU DK005]|uniref:GDSL-type esterase/lipase family protein n=1 Tax=Kineococcus sp. SYSU DK005 TaxID=3383126 RepID=UPI003D7EF102
MKLRLVPTTLVAAASCLVLSAPATPAAPRPAAHGTSASAATGTSAATGIDGADGAGGDRSGDWVAAWTTSPQGVYPYGYTVGQPGTPGEVLQGFEQPLLTQALPERQAQDQTLRMIVHPGIGGETWRVKLSNRFGTRPVTFARASAALQESGARLVPGTSQPLTFAGQASVTLQPGEEVRSDPLRAHLSDADAQRSNVAISLHVTGASGPMTWHAASFTTSYLTDPGAGDHTGAVGDDAFAHPTTSWFFVSGLEVQRRDAATVVALGDSITDGFFSTVNGDDRWPDLLQRRLLDTRAGSGGGGWGGGGWSRGGSGRDSGEEVISVVNQGIGGNMVTRVGRLPGGCQPCDGPSAADRLEQDVLSQPGVRAVIWLEGINDLGGGGAATAEQVIAGMREVAARLDERGIALIGATLTPSGGSAVGPDYGSARTDAERREINDFIRSSDVFDAVADFAAATEDPADPSRLLPAYDTNTSVGGAGDGLHPNRAGFQAMAATIDLQRLRDLVEDAAAAQREAA